jgi:uncharacterized protein
LEYATEKLGGHPQYRCMISVLGEDDHGTWVWRQAGHPIIRGTMTVTTPNMPALILVPPEAWWSVSWWPGHQELDLYVNIGTPAVWEDERIVCVDLDLDVIRFVDGRVELVDQDEFEEHQVRYGYPPELVTAATNAAAESLDLVRRNVAPFDGTAAERWKEQGFALAG